MKARSLVARALLVVGLLLLFAPAAGAAEIKVMSSAGFKAAYLELAAEFQRATGHRIANAWGPSMGSTPQAVPNRIARGEPVDVIIVVGDALDKLIEDGKVVASSRSDLARSLIGAAVQAGTPKPDISSVEAFKKTLANARSIAYSDSASGVYIETVLYKRLDVSDEVKAKSKMIPAEPVGEIIARGDAELGFQQMSPRSTSCRSGPARGRQADQSAGTIPTGLLYQKRGRTHRQQECRLERSRIVDDVRLARGVP